MPPYSFMWSGPAGFSSADQNLTNLFAGFYTLQVTDQPGRTARVAVQILGQQPLELQAKITPASCVKNDGCIDVAVVSGAAPFSYQWSETGLDGKMVCGLMAGTYSVTVTDGNSCSQTASCTVWATDKLDIKVVGSNADCSSGQSGTAAALPQNGLPPYQYQWSYGGPGPVITGLFAGVFSVTVTDATGCTGTGQVTVSDTTVASWGLELVPDCILNLPAGNLLLRADQPSNIHFPITLHWSNGSASTVQAPTGDTLEVLGFVPQGKHHVMVIDSLGCTQLLSTVLTCILIPEADSTAVVWPGDLDSNRAVNHHDLLYLGLGYGASGPPRPNASPDWTGQPALLWPQSTAHRAVNYRNLDANGDGLVNASDTLAILANWGQVIQPEVDDPFAAPVSVPGMSPTPAPALSFAPDTLVAGQAVAIPVVIGSAAAPVDSLHGLSFSISYDPNILHPVWFEPLPSWFGDPANGLLCIQRHFPGQHRLDVALTRTDGMPVNGYGVIGRTFIVIEDDIFFRKPQNWQHKGSGDEEVVTTQLFLRNVQGVTPANTQPEIIPQTADIVIRQTVNSPEIEKQTDTLLLWPNPAAGLLHLASPDVPLHAVEVWDILGRRQLEINGNESSHLDISLQQLMPGWYLVKVGTAKGPFIKAFIRL